MTPKVQQRIAFFAPDELAVGVDRAFTNSSGPGGDFGGFSRDLRRALQLALEDGVNVAGTLRFVVAIRDFAPDEPCVGRSQVAGFQAVEHGHDVDHCPAFNDEIDIVPLELGQ